MAADDQGNIGYWHPGLLQLKPRGLDERLPYPGTGEAEWRGFLPPSRRPQVVNPKQGYLFNWNNVPSAGWTQGDAPARERLIGRFHRGAWLERQVKASHRRGGGYEQSARVDRLTGTIAQQRPLASARPAARVARVATGDAAHRAADDPAPGTAPTTRSTDDGTVDPGVAAWEEFKTAGRRVAIGRLPREARCSTAARARSHAFDASNGDGYALRTLGPRGYRQAAQAGVRGSCRSGSGRANPAKWREPRRLYKPSAQGAGSFPEPFPFFDRGHVPAQHRAGALAAQYEPCPDPLRLRRTAVCRRFDGDDDGKAPRAGPAAAGRAATASWRSSL